MKFTSLDAITRSVLQQRQLPIHYYLQYLKHASDCFRELHFDTLRVVNAKLLPVTSYGAVELPCDYVDFVKVGVAVGQMVKPLHQAGGINRMYYTENGHPAPYPTSELSATTAAGAGIHQSEEGENIGRFYGFHDGLLQDTFKVLPEKNVIQLNQNAGVKEIVLEYISDGTYCDAATKVDPLAQACIEAYMKWKVSRSADNPRSAEGVNYTTEWKKLKARKNPLTTDDIKRIIKAATKPTIK